MDSYLKKDNEGITLIALVVTIIVLLILAGISIATLTGDNSIIKQAGNARDESEVAKEKEMLELAAVKAMGKDKNGNITVKNLSDELENQGVSIRKSGKNFIVTFNNKEKEYKIDSNGNVSDYVAVTQTDKIYAKLYIDNTVILSSFNYTDPNRELKTDYGYGKGFRSSGCTTVIIYDDIAPVGTYCRLSFSKLFCFNKD